MRVRNTPRDIYSGRGLIILSTLATHNEKVTHFENFRRDIQGISTCNSIWRRLGLYPQTTHQIYIKFFTPDFFFILAENHQKVKFCYVQHIIATTFNPI